MQDIDVPIVEEEEEPPSNWRTRAIESHQRDLNNLRGGGRF